jgi:hypothetical protein
MHLMPAKAGINFAFSQATLGWPFSCQLFRLQLYPIVAGVQRLRAANT